jgi:hypothetical protein
VRVAPTAEPTFPQRVRIYRRYAEWKEDAVSVVLPADIDPTDRAAVDEWAMENYDALYLDAKARKAGEPVTTNAEIEWEDEFKGDLDFPESEIEAELL